MTLYVHQLKLFIIIAMSGLYCTQLSIRLCSGKQHVR